MRSLEVWESQQASTEGICDDFCPARFIGNSRYVWQAVYRSGFVHDFCTSSLGTHPKPRDHASRELRVFANAENDQIHFYKYIVPPFIPQKYGEINCGITEAETKQLNSFSIKGPFLLQYGKK